MSLADGDRSADPQTVDPKPLDPTSPRAPVGWPLSLRFLALLVPVVAIVLLPALTIPPYLQYRMQIDELDNKLERMIQNHSIVLSRAVSTLDKRMTNLVMASVFSDADVVFAEIIARNGEVVLRLGNPPEKGTVRSGPIRYVVDDKLVQAGTVRMGASYERAVGEFRRSMIFAAATALLAAIVLCVATWLIFSAMISDRLRRLQRAMSRWRAGEPERVQARGGNDEIAQLWRTFDELQEARLSHEQSLEEIRGDLERRVDERTLELSVARDAAERASRAKADFLAAVSHEIRTPLNAILGIAGALDGSGGGASSAEHRRKLSLIEESGKSLRALLDDVLDLSKAEAGYMRIVPTPEDLAMLLDSICAFWREEAESKGLKLSLDIGSPRPPKLMVDALRMRQAVGNLISNAVKFTDQGEVRVDVRARPIYPDADDGPWRLTVRVSDTGIGMSAQTLRRLFQAFEQGDNSITRRFGGTGLGLALTRHLVGLMDGEITVESTLGAGSSFTMTMRLDAAKTERTGASLQTDATSRAGLDGRRVLVVDDVTTNRLVARLMLEPLGAIVEEAASAEHALAELEREPADLV
ncbi:MAG: ATP-binding protein, partial [Pseudomonadota bacterium]